MKHPYFFATTILLILLGCRRNARDIEGTRELDPATTMDRIVTVNGRGRRVGIFVGINYDGTDRLKCAVNDAVAVRDLLRDEFAFDSSTFLSSKTASKSAVVSALTSELEALNLVEDDSLIFYFAGHGEDGFLAASDSVRTDKSTWIEMKSVRHALNDLPCRHKLLILDTCYSGSLLKKDRHDWEAPNNRDKSQPSLRQVRTGDAVFKDCERRAFFFAITAGRDDATINDEYGNSGHSLFTYALLDALKDRAKTGRDDQAFLSTSLAADVAVRVADVPDSSQRIDYGYLSEGDGDFIFRPTKMRNTSTTKRCIYERRRSYLDALSTVSVIAKQSPSEALVKLEAIPPMERDFAWWSLQASLAKVNRTVFLDATTPISHLATLSTGRVATIDDGNVLALWDPGSRTKLEDCLLKNGEPEKVVVSRSHPDWAHVHENGTVEIWTAKDDHLARVAKLDQQVAFVAFANDKRTMMFSHGEDQLSLLHLDSKKVEDIESHGHPASLTRDIGFNKIFELDMARSRINTWPLDDAEAAIKSVAFAPLGVPMRLEAIDRDRVVVSGTRGIQLHDLSTGRLVRQIDLTELTGTSNVQASNPQAFDYSSDLVVIAMGSTDAIYLSTNGGLTSSVVLETPSSITDVQLVPNQNSLIARTLTGAVPICTPSPDRQMRVIAEGVLCVNLAGDRVVVGTNNQSILALDSVSGSVLHGTKIADYPSCLTESPTEEDEVMVGTIDGMLLAVDLPNGKSRQFSQLNSGVSSIDWCKGAGLICKGNDGLLRKLENGTLVKILEQKVGDARISAAGNLVFAAGDGSLVIYDPKRAVVLARQRVSADSLDLEASNNLLAVTNASGLSVLGLNDDFDKLSVIVDSRPMACADISSNGRLVAVGFDDGVTIWDLFTGKKLASLKSPDPVHTVEFSPNGRSVFALTTSDLLMRYP